MEMNTIRKSLLDSAKSHYQEIIEEVAQAQSDQLKGASQHGDALDLQEQSFIDETTQTIERENRQIHEAEKELALLQQIHPDGNYQAVSLGAIVETDQMNFFIGVPMTQTQVGNKTYVGISTQAPIYQAMKGLKEKEAFSFNGRNYVIRKIV